MKRRLLIPLLGALVICLGAGVAYAYFTSTGSGGGNATVGSLQTVTVAATAGSPSTPLYPGQSGDVVLQLTNPNSFAVTLVSVAGDGAVGVDGEHSGCDPSVVSFTDQTGLTINIPGGVTTQVDLPGAAAMTTVAADGCQGATFSIPVTITVHK